MSQICYPSYSLVQEEWEKMIDSKSVKPQHSNYRALSTSSYTPSSTSSAKTLIDVFMSSILHCHPLAEILEEEMPWSQDSLRDMAEVKD